MRPKPPQDARASANTQPYAAPYQAFLIKLYTPKLAPVKTDDPADGDVARQHTASATSHPPAVILQHAHNARCLEFASLAEAFNYLHTLTKESASAS